MFESLLRSGKVFVCENVYEYLHVVMYKKTSDEKYVKVNILLSGVLLGYFKEFMKNSKQWYHMQILSCFKFDLVN